jgi:hypothetical protein
MLVDPCISLSVCIPRSRFKVSAIKKKGAKLRQNYFLTSNSNNKPCKSFKNLVPPTSKKTFLLWRVLIFEEGQKYELCGSGFTKSESVFTRRRMLTNKNGKNIV